MLPASGEVDSTLTGLLGRSPCSVVRGSLFPVVAPFVATSSEGLACHQRRLPLGLGTSFQGPALPQPLPSQTVLLLFPAELSSVRAVFLWHVGHCCGC